MERGEGASILRGERSTGFRWVCEHCGKGVEIDFVPKNGRSFAIPRNVVDQLRRIADRMDRMNVEMIQIKRGAKSSELTAPPSNGVAEDQLPAQSGEQ